MTSIVDECRLYAEYFREAIYDRETKRRANVNEEKSKETGREHERKTKDDRGKRKNRASSLLFAADLRNEIEALVAR